MTAIQLLKECQAAGVSLHAEGPTLKFQAAPGALTPALRAQLKQNKTELLVLLKSPPLITLSPTGLTVPLPVLELAWDLEARGFAITVGADNVLCVEPRHTLTVRDRRELERWEKHLAALTVFCDEIRIT